MDTSALLDQIEENPRKASSLLRQHQGRPGLSRAYCDRVVAHFGADTGKALRLGALWKTVLAYGDEPALAHRARAIYERLRGRWSDSAAAFITAGANASDVSESFAFQRGAIDSLARGGRIDEAIALGESLILGLEQLGDLGSAARVRMNLGNAFSWQDRMDEAREHYVSAIPVLKQNGFLVDAASARMGLSTSHLYGGRLIEAAEHAELARGEATNLNLDYLAALCELNLSHIEMLSGRSDAALDRLLRLREQLADAPVDLSRTLESLGDAYYRLNLWPEAIDAYTEALAMGNSLIALHRGHLHLGLGQALRAAGRLTEASAELRLARRRYRQLDNRAWLAAAITAQAQVLLGQGKVGQAKRLARSAVRQALDAGARFHYVEALLTVASADEEADLAEAERIIRREGYVGLTWKVHYLQSRRGPVSKRLLHLRRMFAAINTGRMQVASFASRASYLRDKSEAVQAYLALLLSRGTDADVREAVGVIEQTRSATLLDELLTARGGELSGDVLERLRRLRKELNELGADDVSGGAARRAVGTGGPIASLQRRWLDLSRDLKAQVEEVVPGGRHEGVIFAGPGQKIFAITAGDVASRYATKLLPIGKAELEKRLKWLQFELLAPMADRDTDEHEATAMVAELARVLVEPWLEGQAAAICPEGILWRVPWQACVPLVCADREAELRLHPSLGGHGGAGIRRQPRVALWASNAVDLVHAGAETQAFLRTFPDAEVYTSGDGVREGMSGEYDLVHVVAHAKHRTTNPMFSAISFDDGPVFAAEIVRLGIKADLVCLSACETGAMSLITRDEPDGLARAFLARGARNVIASQWPLDDEAAARIFATFFTSLVGGGSVADSLSRARKDARAWRPHPYFWGSLSLYGGYANT